MQNEIVKKQKLLNSEGFLINPGYAKKLFWEYDRKDIKANKFRIKEWDYYLIVNDNKGVAFTIADNAYIGFVSVSLLDFDEKTYVTYSSIIPFTMGKLKLPPTSETGDVVFKNKKILLSYLNDGESRTIKCEVPKFNKGKSFKCNLKLTNIPTESMVIATPFPKNKKAFYYNQKINCMTANGEVVFGDETILFEDAFGTLDWGRGVWTYDNTWLWGTASGKVNGKAFGFNIGYGFGDTSKASENMIFYDGKAHKLDQVRFEIPMENGKFQFMNDWKLTSNDGRFEFLFTPILDRYDKISLLLLVSDQHQVFGRLNGYVILDDGTKIEVKDLLGSAEIVRNKW